MIASTKLQCIPKAEFDPSSLTGTFQALNATGTSDPIKMLQIFNPSLTVSVEISLDGVTPHIFVPPTGTLIVDFQANHDAGCTSGGGTLNLQKYQIIYGRTAPNPTYIQIIGYL